ncbi:MAG: hypothetical protein Q4P66_05220 [Actinomycetaceae bacterium]|nr:hypothetical protein [Actinomycetaceae bacterium]
MPRGKVLCPGGAGNDPSGFLLIDKPRGLTSQQVVSRVRRACGIKKVGHAGTLDPMATGLLLIGVGKATRLLTYLVGADKSYCATVRFGVATVSDDKESSAVRIVGAQIGGNDKKNNTAPQTNNTSQDGTTPQNDTTRQVTTTQADMTTANATTPHTNTIPQTGTTNSPTTPTPHNTTAPQDHTIPRVNTHSIDDTLAQFRGRIDQVPSAVSAKKIAGQRAYKLVRAGADVQLEPRQVTISNLRRMSEPTALYTQYETEEDTQVMPALLGDAGTVMPSQATATDSNHSNPLPSLSSKPQTDDISPTDTPLSLIDIPVVDVDIDMRCSSGTYVRALARDLGEYLGNAAHLTALRRYSVHTFSVEDAVTLDDIARQAASPSGVCLLDSAQVMRQVLSLYQVSSDTVADIACGRAVSLDNATPISSDKDINCSLKHYESLREESIVGLVDTKGRFIAVAKRKGAELRPRVVVI